MILGRTVGTGGRDRLHGCADQDVRRSRTHVVYPKSTDPAMTMPLPARVSGVWMKDVTHPRIEKFTPLGRADQAGGQLQEEFLKKLEELKKELPPAPAMKKGWSDLVVNGSQLAGFDDGWRSVWRHGGRDGGICDAGSRSPVKVPGPTAIRGRWHRRTGFRWTRLRGMPPELPNRRQDHPIEDLIKKSDKERAKEILNTSKRWSASSGELLLFRYIDFSANPQDVSLSRSPRVPESQLQLQPQCRRSAGDTSVVTGETRTSDWSNPTASRGRFPRISRLS